MARFHGYIGYIRIEESETAPGVYNKVSTERECSGDILRNSKRWENGEKVNNDLTIDNRFSIVADEFAITNSQFMQYLKISGTCWNIKSFEIQRPRIILTIGGVYNGK